MSNPIITEIDTRGVATLSLNRPEIHNAFDDILIQALTSALEALAVSQEVRLVVLSARGRSFCAGADLNWMRRMADYSRDENLADAMALAGLMQTLDRLPKPVIARVQGAALGGGVGLIACCDMAVAASTAVFSLSEVKLGLIPAAISPYVVAAMGARQARRYFLSGERFDAGTAQRLGLIHEVVGGDALDEALDALVTTLLSNGPNAMAAAKDLIHRVAHGSADNTMIRDTAERIAEIRATDEGREGVAAFLEKRKPRW